MKLFDHVVLTGDVWLLVLSLTQLPRSPLSEKREYRSEFSQIAK